MYSFSDETYEDTNIGLESSFRAQNALYLKWTSVVNSASIKCTVWSDSLIGLISHYIFGTYRVSSETYYTFSKNTFYSQSSLFILALGHNFSLKNNVQANISKNF